MQNTIILIGKYLFVVPPILAGIVAVRVDAKKRMFFVVMAASAAVFAYLLTLLAGHLYFDVRPFVAQGFVPLIAHSADNGFPSDHSVVAFTAAFLIWPFDKYISIVAIILALLVGSARVLAGIHHPLDVAGAIGIAAVACLAGFAIASVLTPKDSSAK